MDNYEGVEDTLFIPLTARIIISKRFPEYFYDKKALEMEYLIKNSSIEKKIIRIYIDGFCFKKL